MALPLTSDCENPPERFHALRHCRHGIERWLPGLVLAATVALAASQLEVVERSWLGEAPLEGLVIALLLGTAIRTAVDLPPAVLPGLKVAATLMLEIAIVLNGAGFELGELARHGLPFVAVIVAVVVAVVPLGYVVGRLARLPRDQALLIACGNAICGNSAIMALAPVIGATSADVAAAIAFTSGLGILVVVALPTLAILAGLNSGTAGFLSGMTVYAVPQVLAATAPLGLAATHIAMLAKMVRVLMLGPLAFVLAILVRRRGPAGILAYVPWFIVGFLLMIAARSASVFGPRELIAIKAASGPATTIAMAGLGLGIRLSDLGRSSLRAILAAALGLVLIAGIAVLALPLLANHL